MLGNYRTALPRYCEGTGGMSQSQIFELNWDVDYDGLRSEVAQYFGSNDLGERGRASGAFLPDGAQGESIIPVPPFDEKTGKWLPILKAHKERLENFLQVPMDLGSSYTIQKPNSTFVLHTDIMAYIFYRDMSELIEFTRFTDVVKQKIRENSVIWFDLQTMINQDASDPDDISKNIVDNLYRWCLKWNILDNREQFDTLFTDDLYNKWMNEAPRASINIVLDEDNARTTPVTIVNDSGDSVNSVHYRIGVLNTDKPHTVLNNTDTHRIMAKFTVYRMTHKEVFEKFKQVNFSID